MPRGRCWGISDPDIFFPEPGHSSLPAKEICLKCKIKSSCARNNLEEDYGIWGGLNTKDRKQVKEMLKKGISFHISVRQIDADTRQRILKRDKRARR